MKITINLIGVLCLSISSTPVVAQILPSVPVREGSSQHIQVQAEEARRQRAYQACLDALKYLPEGDRGAEANGCQCLLEGKVADIRGMSRINRTFIGCKDPDTF